MYRLVPASIRPWILAWAAALAALVPPSVRADVPPALDLRNDAEQARTMGAPLLLIFVGNRCGYCDIALNDFLVPMSGNRDYSGRVLMRRIVRDSDAQMRDFDGSLTTHRRFAKKIGVRMTPVVQMFNDRGLLLGKPLVGLTTLDYYGYYLDQTIDQAVAQVGKNSS